MEHVLVVDRKELEALLPPTPFTTENMETIRMTTRHLDSGICATDLAGAESLFPTEMFADVFALAKKREWRVNANPELTTPSPRFNGSL